MTRTQKIAWEWAVQWCALKRCLTECRMLRRSSGEFRSFRVSGKYSGMRSGGRGTHRKDTGNIGNNRGAWELTGVPLTTLPHGSAWSLCKLQISPCRLLKDSVSTPGGVCVDSLWTPCGLHVGSRWTPGGSGLCDLGLFQSQK